MHFPDEKTPLEETLGALDALVRAGKVREIGCSNFSAEMIEESARISADHGWARFVSVQNEYSLLRRAPEKQGVLDACAEARHRVHPVLPARERRALGQVQAGGRAARGNPARGHARRPAGAGAVDTPRWTASRRSTRGPGRHGRTLLELAFAWLLARPVVACVIAGATKPEQVAANAAAGGLILTDADMAEIDAVISAAKGR